MNGNRQTSGDPLFDLFVAKEREELICAVLEDADAPQAPAAESQVTDIPMPPGLLEPGAIALRYACSKCGGHNYALELRTPEGVSWAEIHSERSANLPKGAKSAAIIEPAKAATRGYVAGLECPNCGTLLVRCLARNAAHHAAAAGEVQEQ
jgi:predicted RNA-binding Zn-ribbon protein involved in translation (DUF1610 family)